MSDARGLSAVLSLLGLLVATGAQADGCGAQAARVAAAVGASVAARTGATIELRHPAVATLQLHCDGPALWKASGGGGPGALDALLPVLARSADLLFRTGEPAARAALLACVGAGERAPGQLSEATRAGLTVECTIGPARVSLDVRQAVE